MKLLFIDESYDYNCKDKFFVLAGIVLDENIWEKAKNKIEEIKKTNNIQSELKWKYIFKRDPKNPYSHLTIENRLNNIIKPILEFIRDNKIEIFTTLTHIESLEQEFIEKEKIDKNSDYYKERFGYYCYHKNYENIVERFEYYLEDTNSKGMVICDNRAPNQDKDLINIHNYMEQKIKELLIILI